MVIKICIYLFMMLTTFSFPVFSMNDEETDENKVKVMFLGDQSVGKSCILNRFINDTFTEKYQATIGLDFGEISVQINSQDIHLLLYDTSGQEKFRSLIPMYTRDANIILLVYDISSKESFAHLSDWLCDLTNIKKEEVIFAVVGNKIDLDNRREVTKEEGSNYAKERDFIFAEVSAKTGEGIKNLFREILNKIPKDMLKKEPLEIQPQPQPQVIYPQGFVGEIKKNCCFCC